MGLPSETGFVCQVISLREERGFRSWVNSSTLPNAAEICETHREQVLPGDYKVNDGLEKMHFSVLHILWFIGCFFLKLVSHVHYQDLPHHSYLP